MEKLIPPVDSDSLREQGGAVVSGVRAAVLQATRHLEALSELLMLELREYRDAQLRRVVRIAAGAALLVAAYLLLCMAVVCTGFLLWGSAGLYVAFGVVVLFSMLAGLALLCSGISRKPEGLAPATCRELKDDIQCIKLYLKGKEKS